MKIKSVEDYLKEPYARVLIPEAEGGYSAAIMEFPGCYTFGETADETLSNLKDAAANWIEAALSQGQKIPEAFANYEGSGKVALRLPRSTHHKAVQMAANENMSLNTFIVGAVEARVGVRGFYDELIQRLEGRLVAKTAANVMARVMPMLQTWDDIASSAALHKRAATTTASPFVLNNNVVVEVNR